MPRTLGSKAFNPLYRINQRQGLIEAGPNPYKKYHQDKTIQVGVRQECWPNAGKSEIADHPNAGHNNQHRDDLAKRLRELRVLVSAKLIHECGLAYNNLK